jgi:hypothetical protein
MLLVACSALLLTLPNQIIDGIKPVFDPAPKFAQAFVNRSQEEPAILQKADPFITAFFLGKAKSMAPLTQTKYTAAQMGICGTILNIFDPALGTSIRAATDRIGKGTKDFDVLTVEEREAIQKAQGESKLVLIANPKTTAADQWKFLAGTHLGMLAGYVTVWHISPKQVTLLQFISDGAKGCAEHAEKPEASGSSELATALKGFAKFSGKTIDEPTIREIGAQVEATLRAATPAKHRW